MNPSHFRLSVRRLAGVTLLEVLTAAFALPAVAAERGLKLISIATGARTGVYYFAGGTICGRVNAHRWQTGIRCVVEETGGSIDNLNALRAGTADFAIVQSDWQYAAVKGTGVMEGLGPDPDLRAVLSLFPEPFTVVARPQSGITSLTDLVGKRVDVGAAGSGSRATADVVMKAMGWTADDFAHLSELAWRDLPRALCDGEIDAAMFTIAHPNLVVEEMITSCDAVLVPVENDKIRALMTGNPYYFPYAIAGGTYPDQRASVPSFALAATLVTSARVAPSTVHEVVASIFENLETFRNKHPTFAIFKDAQMLTEGLTAPMHFGALRYVEEAGLSPVASAEASQGGD